jgi:hypothetical protein
MFVILKGLEARVRESNASNDPKDGEGKDSEGRFKLMGKSLKKEMGSVFKLLRSNLLRRYEKKAWVYARDRERERGIGRNILAPASSELKQNILK